MSFCSTAGARCQTPMKRGMSRILLLVAVLFSIVGCGGNGTTGPTPPAQPTVAVQVGVQGFEAHFQQGDTGDVSSISIDGTSLPLSRVRSGGSGGILTVTATASLTKGSHTAVIDIA